MEKVSHSRRFDKQSENRYKSKEALDKIKGGFIRETKWWRVALTRGN